jgi:hypothetical protein
VQSVARSPSLSDTPSSGNSHRPAPCDHPASVVLFQTGLKEDGFSTAYWAPDVFLLTITSTSSPTWCSSGKQRNPAASIILK